MKSETGQNLSDFIHVNEEGEIWLKVGTRDTRFKCRIANVASAISALDFQWDFVMSRHVLERSNSSCGQKDVFSCTSE